MSRKSLTLSQSQCRFLGDLLKMEGFEEKLVDSPLEFLKDFVRSYKLNVPFSTIESALTLKQTEKTSPYYPMAEIQREVLSGRGGPCVIGSPFVEDFLRSVGFRAHLIDGFNVVRSMRRDYFHAAIVVRDVEEDGDAFHLDVATFLPLMSVTDMTKVIKQETEDAVASAPSVHSLQSHYELLNLFTVLKRSANDVAFHSREGGDDDRQKMKFSSQFDLRELETFLDKSAPVPPLVIMYSKDDLIGAFRQQLAHERSGVWLPFHVFPTPVSEFDFDVRRSQLKDHSSHYLIKQKQLVLETMIVSGFGRKTGEFVLLYGEKYFRRRESKAASTNASNGSSTTALTGAATTAPMIQTEVKLLQSHEEALAIVSEEFPALTEQYREAMTFMPELGQGMRDA